MPAAIVDGAIEGGISLAGVGFMAGSGLLHIGYFSSLQHAYEKGDLSVVYPLARGSGPVLSVAAAILFLGERPSTLALAGGLLIVAARAGAGRRPGGGHRRRPGHGRLHRRLHRLGRARRRHARPAPIVYFCGAETFRALILAPFALRADVGKVWRENRGAILGVGALSPLAYVLVLFALTRAPISLVAPVRESSVVLGAILGAGVLKEGKLGRRILAASAIAIGIAALALS